MKPSAPLALIATGHLSAAPFTVPIWVKLLCATAMALATLSGGWRIINTMGNRITTVESPQGFAAESSSAATILASSYYGYPLSTTQIVSGGVMGAGLGKRGGIVHWPVVGQMATPWVITLPSAALVAFAMWRISDLFGTNTNAGAIVITLLAAAIAFGLYVLSKRNAITARGSRPHERDTGARGATGSPSDPCIRLTIMFVVASPIVDWSAI
jgi:PiT family inorganic phosphate transporter